MTGVSWRPGCPVPLASLRLLSLSYWGFDGQVHRGELIVNTDVTAAMLTAFRLLFAARYPIHRMRLVEAYGQRRAVHAGRQHLRVQLPRCCRAPRGS